MRKPRDKSKVETAVQIVERWILARLRNRQFSSPVELNVAIDELLNEVNNRPFQKLDGSRRSRFIELDRPALKALPSRAYEYAQWKLAKVHPDYHVEVDHAYYSVPYQIIGERVEVRLSARMIEIIAKRQLVASHVRSYKQGARATLDAHRPATHRAIVDATIERLMQRAEAIAPSVAQVLREQFNRKRHPEEALASHRASCDSLRTLFPHGSPPLASAHSCSKAAITAAYVHSSSRHPANGDARQLSLVQENVRGPDYFH